MTGPRCSDARLSARAGGLKGQPKPRLPRAMRYLSPIERGLIAFLDALAVPPGDQRKAA